MSRSSILKPNSEKENCPRDPTFALGNSLLYVSHVFSIRYTSIRFYITCIISYLSSSLILSWTWSQFMIWEQRKLTGVFLAHVYVFKDSVWETQSTSLYTTLVRITNFCLIWETFCELNSLLQIRNKIFILPYLEDATWTTLMEHKCNNHHFCRVYFSVDALAQVQLHDWRTA